MGMAGLCGLLIGGLAVAATAAEDKPRDGARDFDFLMGSWTVHNRRLRERLHGSTAWDEFEATSSARPLLGGIGNEDVYRTEFIGGFTGMSFRFYDKATARWSIYWADSRRGVLDPPVVGAFAGDVGTFEGADVFEGRPIRVRFIWSRITTPTPRWEQAFSVDGGKSWETNWVMDFARSEGATAQEFPTVELRRYAIRPGERDRFAQAFDAYFPEAFQQLGAIVFGQGLERGHDTWFTWLRGFPSYEARAEGMWAMYSGPVWKEHAARMNDRLLDAGNVLLLRPLGPGRGLRVLPAVDVASERAGGVIVMQIFAVQFGKVDVLAARAEESFAAYRTTGAREAGVLVSLERPNNFPRHVVRDDGPFVVWVGVVPDEAILNKVTAIAGTAAVALSASGWLRGEPEWVVLDPTSRSRLRWPDAN
jgi:NIPSNAP protein